VPSSPAWIERCGARGSGPPWFKQGRGKADDWAAQRDEDGRKWPSVHPARPSFALILAVLTGAQLMIWIDNTILIVAVQVLSDPAAGLAATPEQLEWSISAYTLAFAALMLTGGSLADRFGCRSVLVVGMVIFAAASGGPPGRRPLHRSLRHEP
jgi:hypothetical protein